MRVILEGPDNAGKTSLARAIVQACPEVKYHHPGGKPENFDHEQACVVEQTKWLYADHCIVDRITPISQQVYNADSVLDRIRQLELQALLDMKPVVIYCRPSIDRLMRFEDFTWRDGETEEHKQKVISRQHEFIERYDRIMQTVPNLCYDFDSSTADLIRSKLINAFKGSGADEAWFYGIMNYRG